MGEAPRGVLHAGCKAGGLRDAHEDRALFFWRGAAPSVAAIGRDFRPPDHRGARFHGLSQAQQAVDGMRHSGVAPASPPSTRRSHRLRLAAPTATASLSPSPTSPTSDDPVTQAPTSLAPPPRSCLPDGALSFTPTATMVAFAGLAPALPLRPSRGPAPAARRRPPRPPTPLAAPPHRRPPRLVRRRRRAASRRRRCRSCPPSRRRRCRRRRP